MIYLLSVSAARERTTSEPEFYLQRISEKMFEVEKERNDFECFVGDN